LIFFFFLLEKKLYIIPSGAILSSILDMRKGKQSLHFVVDDELLPHAIVNIPNDENIHFGVYYFHFLFILYYSSYLYLFYL
jgi:hypothetical protein